MNFRFALLVDLLLFCIASSDHNISLQHTCLCSVSCGVPLNDTSLLTNTSDPTITTGPVCLLQNVSYTHTKPDQERQVEQVARLCFYANTSSSGVSQCSEHSNSTIPLFPGQLHTINILTADRLGEYLPQPIIVQTSNSWQVGRVEQVFGENSSEVSFSIASNDIDTSGVVQFSVPTYDAVAEVSVYLKNCPIGFDLDTDSMTCQCSSFISNIPTIKCDNNTGILTVHSSSWIGVSFNNTLAYTSNCPINYCPSMPVLIRDVSSERGKCLGNHVGLSCGPCEDGYSVVFGDVVCLRCSHWYLLTIPVYAVAGILLVIGVFALDLTIYRGTVIGPVLLSNIVFAANVYSFSSIIDAVKPLFIWVSLMGLSLGFPICFFDGMTALHKEVLEFIFPAYVISIVVVIIIVSRCSQRVNKLVSHSSVKVLATVIYFSYGKVIKTLFNVLQYNTITLANGETKIVWLLDASVPFLGGWHAVVCAFVLLIFLMVILPYILLITFGPFLVYRWKIIVKLKPFMDAHSGPYKDRYRYWFGVRLWIITALAAITAAARTYNFILILIGSIILNVLFVIEAFVKPYKSTTLNYLDSGMLLPVVLGLTGSLAVICASEQSNFLTVFISLLAFISFTAFCGIVFFHVNEMFQLVDKIKQRWFPKYTKKKAVKPAVKPTVKVNLPVQPVNVSDCSTINEEIVFIFVHSLMAVVAMILMS